MKIVPLSELNSGTVLAKSIFSANGRPLLKQGVEISSSYIGRLERMGIKYVYIEDSVTVDIKDADIIPTEIRQEVVGRLEVMFHRLREPQGLKHMVKSGNLGKEILGIYQVLQSHIVDNGTMIVNLSALYSNDAHTYTHCMNVAVISTVLGLAHGYSKDVVEQLGMGAMVHDIGKIEISPAIINKPGKLTAAESEQMKLHTRFGYEILSKQPNLSESAAECALYHHEWYDGAGYLHGLKETQIPEFARLMAVADVYDALTSNRPYHEPMLPSDALEFLFTKTYQQFDPTFIRHFVRHVNIYPVGLPVRLSSEASGIIAKTGATNLQRPIILITEEHDEAVTPYEFDLAEHLNVTIVGHKL